MVRCLIEQDFGQPLGRFKCGAMLMCPGDSVCASFSAFRGALRGSMERLGAVQRGGEVAGHAVGQPLWVRGCARQAFVTVMPGPEGRFVGIGVVSAKETKTIQQRHRDHVAHQVGQGPFPVDGLQLG